MNAKIQNELQHYSVLLAEDEKGIQEETKEILELFFKNVYIAGDGVEANELYEKFKPDLIITDIKMPKLNGLDLAKKIRLKDNKTFIAIVSAHTDLTLMLMATELNLIKYIVKPIIKSKLFELFELFIEKKSSQNIIYLNKDFIFYKNQAVIMNHEQKYKLTLKESEFLSLLLKKKAIVIYHEIEEILQSEDFYSENSIRQFIKKIRQKLPKNYLKNIQNQGYTLTREFL